MRQISRSSITALLGLALVMPAVGCIQADDAVDEGVGDGDTLEAVGAPDELATSDESGEGDGAGAELEDPGTEPGLSGVYCPTGNTTDVIKTVVVPDYPVFGGTSATAPDTSYWNDSDGTFTMRAGGILGMDYNTEAFAGYQHASDFNGSTKAACEDLFLGYEIWAYRATTGCYEFVGAGNRRGVWTVIPYSGTHCSLQSPHFTIDTDKYSYVKVSTYAYTNTPIPSFPNIHYQQVLRPTAFISADFE